MSLYVPWKNKEKFVRHFKDKTYENDVEESILDMCRSSHRRCSVKKVFLEILQNSQENTCVRVSFLIKLQASAYLHTLVTYFSINIAKCVVVTILHIPTYPSKINIIWPWIILTGIFNLRPTNPKLNNVWDMEYLF